MTLRVMFVDLNSYFASVEQQLRPELRGRPVAVAAVNVDSSCCLAASYEAKACGVKTGTGIREAKRLCPGLRIVVARPGEYVRHHHRILAAADTCLPVDEVLSIDEFSCRLLGKEREPARAEAIALRMKRAIREGVGECLRCSIGIAPNRYVAKIATDMRKPDGLVTIPLEELPGRLFGLALQDLPGVGPRMEARLRRNGVDSIERFCSLGRDGARAAWESVWGDTIWRWLHGEDVPHPPTHKRSIGHQHVLPPERRGEAGAREVLVRLLHKAAARARHEGYWARRMTVWVSHAGGGGWMEQASFPECHDTLTLMEVFVRLWERRSAEVEGGAPATPMCVGVTLEDVAGAGNATGRLFPEASRRERVSRAMDRANLRFGRNAVYLGAMHGARDSAPTRIAFSSIPDLSLPDSDDENLHRPRRNRRG